MQCFFVSDLHGYELRYQTLWEMVRQEMPQFVLMGGDLLPFGGAAHLNQHSYDNFVQQFMIPGFSQLKEAMGSSYPRFLLILGNDDPRYFEKDILAGETQLLWTYIHNKQWPNTPYDFWGYAHTPPSPFMLKDWERYDVSRYVDPGCIHPMDGRHTVQISQNLKYHSIRNDLDLLFSDRILHRSVVLFHAPPYGSNLDRAALDGQMLDHVPLDVHVGSIAIRRFIEQRQPLITLHGHIHESSRLTGAWQEHIGNTHAFSAAIEPPNLAVIKFDLENPNMAQRMVVD
ncbi:MAG: hypothetical protein GF313_11290 [Caldithrix sp.]|nr:hypothetical protein [Caldithrix sp.]